MLGTFLDKATGLLDRNFLVAYWFPIFIAASIAVLIRARSEVDASDFLDGVILNACFQTPPHR